MALQAAVRCRSRLLRHLTGVARAFSDAPGAVEGGPQEPPLVFARKREDAAAAAAATAFACLPPAPCWPSGIAIKPSRLCRSRAGGSKELRYYVLKDQASSALAVLQSAAYGTPLAGPSGAPRALRGAPPPSVCNSMLVQAAKVGAAGSARLRPGSLAAGRCGRGAASARCSPAAAQASQCSTAPCLCTPLVLSTAGRQPGEQICGDCRGAGAAGHSAGAVDPQGAVRRSGAGPCLRPLEVGPRCACALVRWACLDGRRPLETPQALSTELLPCMQAPSPASTRRLPACPARRRRR